MDNQFKCIRPLLVLGQVLCSMPGQSSRLFESRHASTPESHVPPALHTYWPELRRNAVKHAISSLVFCLSVPRESHAMRTSAWHGAQYRTPPAHAETPGEAKRDTMDSPSRDILHPLSQAKKKN